MKQKKILPREMSFLRMTAQLLPASRHKKTAEEAVSHMLAMQGQQVYSFPHAVFLRTDNTNFSQVKAAFEAGFLVRHRPMRGTVHITHARDYHWLRLTLNQDPGSFCRRQEALADMTEEIFTEAANMAYALLKDNPIGIRRKELFDLWKKNFKRQMNGAVSEQRFCQLLMWGLDRKGLLVEGPMRKNEHLFIHGGDLPAADSLHSGFCFVSEDDRENALAEVAYRYVRGHGPISSADLARWAGLKQSTARLALERTAETGRLTRYQLTEEGLIRKERAGTDADTYYMEDDLAVQTQQCREELSGVMFLPSFDELHVGYQNRSCLTDEIGENLICPSKNGMFKPIIIQNGVVVGVYAKGEVLWREEMPQEIKKEVGETLEAIQRRMEK